LKVEDLLEPKKEELLRHPENNIEKAPLEKLLWLPKSTRIP
jgi:hypothetical protein